LPDDRIADRLTRFAIPHDGGLTLIRDTDRRNISRTRTGAGERFVRNRNLRSGNLLGIVLDPSRLRKNLIELALRNRTNLPSLIEQESARTCRALIQR
jgi:hypothetical protein